MEHSCVGRISHQCGHQPAVVVISHKDKVAKCGKKPCASIEDSFPLVVLFDQADFTVLFASLNHSYFPYELKVQKDHRL